jgi:hypothetical protein
MYDNIKSFIMHNNEKSDFYACMQGVRQGVLIYHRFCTITEKIQNTRLCAI